MADVVVAGHACVDLIPTLPKLTKGFSYAPGALLEVGPATVATGGCAPNTGRALHRLGTRTRLIGRIGDDPFGDVVRRILAEDGLDEGVRIVPDEATSYTAILSPPGEDRMFLHFPGANDSFTERDVTAEALSGARVFHFGYPPVMRRMREDGGDNLSAMLSRAKTAGLATSLDMSYPDPATSAGTADWPRILRRVLPKVDIFMPSLDELLPLLDPGLLSAGAASPDATTLPAARISDLGQDLIRAGAGIVGIKCGPRGLYLRTAPEARLREVGILDPTPWADRELWSSVFEVEAAGTTGAGDATVAGFLHSVLLNDPPEAAITAAVAAGAMSVEAPDAVGGIKSWEETRRRISTGWRRRQDPPGEDWSPLDEPGLWSRDIS